MRKLRISAAVLLLLSLGLSVVAQKTPRRPLPRAGSSADMLIVGGTIVTMDKARRVIEDGAIAIKNGEIIAVGKRADITRRYSSRETMAAAGKVIIPGLINAHTHVPMTLFRGISDDLDLQDWLTKYIFPAEAKNVDEGFVRAGTRLGLAEMIRGGTTTYCDMYYFEDAIADETKKAGVRGVLGESLIDFPAPDNKTFEAALADSERFIKKWQGDDLIVPALAPHAPYTVSPEHFHTSTLLSTKLSQTLIPHIAGIEGYRYTMLT
jgi:5-methylthioadenosine/S-adenosylhomocysteine deaminase